MQILLETGDQVTLIPRDELLTVFRQRNFFYDDADRIRIADEIGGKSGMVYSIERKYAFDYFYFKPRDSNNAYSIPYQSIKIEICK